MVTSYSVDPDQDFQKAIEQALNAVDDLTIPFTLMTKSWFKGNQAIFKLKGPGKYPDLSDKYKLQKQKAVGFIYPILKRTGALEASITDPTDPNAIAMILNKNTLILGTKVPYGSFHQLGIGVPKRPFLLIGAEQTAPPEINQRRDAWIEVLRSYVMQVTQGRGSS